MIEFQRTFPHLFASVCNGTSDEPKERVAQKTVAGKVFLDANERHPPILFKFLRCIRPRSHLSIFALRLHCSAVKTELCVNPNENT